MAKKIYQVGEPCDYCRTPTIPGKGGTGYCKPCYIKWKNEKDSLQPAVQGYNPASAQTHTNAPIVQPQAPSASTERIVDLLTKINQTLEAIEKKLPLYADIDGKQTKVPF